MTTSVRSSSRLMLPVRVGLEFMERLLVADFKGDPEFVGIEPQVFDDPVNGKGMRVLRYRKDGRVDVCRQPGVRVDRSTFVVGAGYVRGVGAHRQAMTEGLTIHRSAVLTASCRLINERKEPSCQNARTAKSLSH